MVKCLCSARRASSRVASALLTRLKLIWARSSLKTTKMSKKRIFAKSSRSQWVNVEEILQNSLHDHITPILINLHWLPVEFRITFKVLLLVYMYKALHGLAPSYISDLLNCKTYSRSLRSSCKEYLVVPRSRLKTYGDRAFSTLMLMSFC